MNPTETAKILAICSVAYPMYPVQKDTVAIYHELLQDLSEHDVRVAVNDLLITSDRWPSIAAIRRKVADNAQALAPGRASAWGEVRKAAHEIGRHYRPKWSHEAIGRAVEIIGWWEICQSDNPEAMRSQFWKVYEEITSAMDSETLTTPGRIALVGGRTALAAIEG